MHPVPASQKDATAARHRIARQIAPTEAVARRCVARCSQKIASAACHCIARRIAPAEAVVRRRARRRVARCSRRRAGGRVRIAARAAASYDPQLQHPVRRFQKLVEGGRQIAFALPAGGLVRSPMLPPRLHGGLTAAPPATPPPLVVRRRRDIAVRALLLPGCAVRMSFSVGGSGAAAVDVSSCGVRRRAPRLLRLCGGICACALVRPTRALLGAERVRRP